MSPSQVLAAIQSSVRVNLSYIDKLVVVCSGRLEQGHVDSIKQFLSWLNYEKYRRKFVFVYNKADQMSLADRQNNLLGVCERFGVTINQQMRWHTKAGPVETIDSNLAIGFPPGASFADVARDHKNFTRAVLGGGESRMSRIPVDKSACTIL